MAATNAQRLRDYKSRVKESGRRPMTVVISNEAADRLHAIAEERAVSPGRALEHVLDVAAPAPASPDKKALIERVAAEALAIVDRGERAVDRHAAGTRRGAR